MRSGPRGEGKSGSLWERADIRALRDSSQWRRKSNTYLCFEKDVVLGGLAVLSAERPGGQLDFISPTGVNLKANIYMRVIEAGPRLSGTDLLFVSSLFKFILHTRVMWNLQ